MDPLALIGLAALLGVKEAGVPIPIPGDLLVLGAGASAAAAGPGPAVLVLAAIVLAGVAGGSVQFALVRRALRAAILSLLVRFGVSRDSLETLTSRLQRTGARGVATARMTPGVRVAAIAASGLAGLPFGRFLLGLGVGNAVFVGAHFALGYALGPAAAGIAGSAGVLALIVAGVVVLGVLGAVAWRAIRRRRSAAPESWATAWADAACPACLALALVRPDGPVPLGASGDGAPGHMV
ncbi:MAG TPA: hypothetical protein VEY67_04185 [Candidatus Dormibacteraeota bacterium]|nr:hypothetical protein [Candidatus Dormibacteraeota bacterium]